MSRYHHHKNKSRWARMLPRPSIMMSPVPPTACPLRQSSAGWAIFWPERSAAPCNPALKPWHWPPAGRPNSPPPLHNRLTASSVLPPRFRLPRPAVPRSRCRIPAGRASLPYLQPYKNNRRCRKFPAPPVVFCFTVRMRHPPHGPPAQRWSLCPHRRAPG